MGQSEIREIRSEIRVKAKALEAFTTAVFVEAGLSPEDAAVEETLFRFCDGF